MAKIFCLLIFFIALFIFPKATLAGSSVVINELLPNPLGGTSEEKIGEWVEIYNVSEEDIDINGWALCDSANHMLIISSEFTTGPTIVKAKNWLLINRNNSTFSLNNSNETIYLIDSSSCEGNKKDNISYESAQEEKSIGRIPDGIGEFQQNLIKSPGSANQAPEPSPEPEKDSISEHSGNSIQSPIPTALSKSKINIPNTNKSSILGKKQNVSPKLLPSNEPSPSPENNDEENNIESNSTVKKAGLITGAGAIFIGFSIAIYFWYHRMKGKVKPPEEDSKIE